MQQHCKYRIILFCNTVAVQIFSAKYCFPGLSVREILRWLPSIYLFKICLPKNFCLGELSFTKALTASASSIG